MPRFLHRQAWAVVFLAIVAILVPACSKPYDGISDYDRKQMAKQTAADEARGTGLKMTEKSYPLGNATAWAVDMKGMKITVDQFRKARAAGYIAELDLSNSTVNDDLIGQMREVGAAGALFKLNLTNTAVTDAGLQKLEGLPYLINLNVGGTKITPSAIDHYNRVRKDDAQIGGAFKKANFTR